MKLLNIALIMFGLLLLITGIFEVFIGKGGAHLGFSIASPWYGLIKIIFSLFMLYPPYDYFKRRWLP